MWIRIDMNTQCGRKERKQEVQEEAGKKDEQKKMYKKNGHFGEYVFISFDGIECVEWMATQL